MTLYGQAVQAAARPSATAYGASVSVIAPAIPAGTFAPGTKIQVGSHRVVIQKYLSEGGFAHVYLVKMPVPINGTTQAVLKRVAVPDREALRGMRTEVETMKRLKGHKPIVTYIDSHASELQGGGYEVFLLMEYCSGGGLIDFMNTRLRHRLTEPEILTIFTDVAEGVACMHYLRPPLLHRDLKVENVLIAKEGSKRRFKLCDFGSAAPPKPAATTTAECRMLDEDVQKHTTMQYRSPEMIDVGRRQAIDEMSDIWALGVLLYKLCYYTTPFEDQGQLAILNASYKFPSHPVFSDRLKKLIGCMLREDPRSRPNIYQVLRDACAMQAREPPIKDIYPASADNAPTSQADQPCPLVGAVFSPPADKRPQALPEVERMRRGRVPASSQSRGKARSSRSPVEMTSGDPFAALDATGSAGDEVSCRFPSLDQFNLLHDRGGKFEFESTAMPSSQPPSQAQTQQPTRDALQLSSSRLSDGTYQSKASSSPASASTSAFKKTVPDAGRDETGEMSLASAIISSNPELQAISATTQSSIRASALTSTPSCQISPVRPNMVSVGTMTCSPASAPERPIPAQRLYPPPDQASFVGTGLPERGFPAGFLAAGTEFATIPRPRSTVPRSSPLQPGTPTPQNRHSSSSRPSLEGARPVDLLDCPNPQLSFRPRPASTTLESSLDYLREMEGSAKASTAYPAVNRSTSLEKDLPSAPEDETSIQSNVDFLRSLEESDSKKKERGFRHKKRASLSSLGSGTKNKIASKFGDAFKRFEGHPPGTPPPRTPSPAIGRGRHNLTPIAGSEATEDRSDDGRDPDLDMTPEMRREHEARILAQEDARVAAAQAEHRQRIAQREMRATGAVTGAATGAAPGAATGATLFPLPRSIAGLSRAVSIQNKVQSLLDETTRSSSNIVRTAQGYGPYTDTVQIGKPDVRPVERQKQKATAPAAGLPPSFGTKLHRGPSVSDPVATARVVPASTTGSGRPAAPPKPMHLYGNPPTGSASGSASVGSMAGSLHKPVMPSSSINVGKIRGHQPTSEVPVAMKLPGLPALEMTATERDDYMRDFQKRFPSLTSIEMVETDIGTGGAKV